MSVEIYRDIVGPVLEKCDSETMKTRAEKALHLAEISPVSLKILELFADKHQRFKDKRLEVTIGNVKFDNPVVVAAGWDKKGIAGRI